MLVRVREDDTELVATEASDDIGRAQALAEHSRDAADQLIAGGMPQRVVDVLEVVEVESQHRAPGLVAMSDRELAVELLPKNGAG